MERDLSSSGQIAERLSAGAVFRAFLALGLTSFGGPVAHIGYFHEAFVVRRRWMDERGYADPQRSPHILHKESSLLY